MLDNLEEVLAVGEGEDVKHVGKQLDGRRVVAETLPCSLPEKNRKFTPKQCYGSGYRYLQVKQFPGL